ncbi:hypothetical protein AB0G71_16715 [Streptomyces sp. NPDC020403]|uniref:hypothetical protein n=1 Tax=unclassified Streptomyces TaxID=2593676 RepID=UPI0033D52E6C
MRSPARLATGTAAAALTAAVLGLAATAIVAPPAYAEDPGRLEFAPATASPGAPVTVNTGACGSDGTGFGDAADLEAGEFELEPGTSGAGATGRFTVPEEAEPGTYAVGVFCDSGEEATGEVQVTAASSTAAAGASSGASAAGSSAWPKPTTEPDPGTAQKPDTGKKPEPGTGTVPESGLGVGPEPATPTEAWPDRPSGHVSTGVGGSIGPDTARIAAGAGVLGAAAVAGACLVRRRASGAQDA